MTTMMPRQSLPLIDSFAGRLVAWQREHGRHDLPWQVSDPYAVWVSEIMLQQTQVDTVMAYYVRFLARFPDVASLAAAADDDVLALWSGLGYYARARNLHAAARQIVEQHGGVFPHRAEAILALPGIGRSTAAAIAAFAFAERAAILDGNVKRVFCRLFGIEGWPGDKAVEMRLWQLAETLLPAHDIRPYTQGLMDLGATLCRRGRPDCARCPFTDDCVANRDGRQSELPATKPRKALPERETQMLVLRRNGEILLEKRPPTGIWGGLWSLPECAPGEDPVTRARRLGYAAEPLGELPRLDHVFSHFRLAIHPRLLTATPLAGHADEPGRMWLGIDDALHAALPTPVRKILASLSP
jgi:A/G-specific adenine glycosylase